MKMVPLLRCENMQEAISFYNRVLDFELKYEQASPHDWVVDLPPIRQRRATDLSLQDNERLLDFVVKENCST